MSHEKHVILVTMHEFVEIYVSTREDKIKIIALQR